MDQRPEGERFFWFLHEITLLDTAEVVTEYYWPRSSEINKLLSALPQLVQCTGYRQPVYCAVSRHPLHPENPAKPIPKRSPCSLQFQGWQRFDQPHNFHWDVPDFWDRLGVRRFRCQWKPMKTVGLLLCVVTMWFLNKYEPSQSWYKSTLLKCEKCGFIWHVIAYSWTILTEWPQQGEANAGFKKGTRQTTTQALFTTNHRWLFARWRYQHPPACWKSNKTAISLSPCKRIDPNRQKRDQQDDYGKKKWDPTEIMW